MWQPIETAPKDGSSILLATPKGRIADGFWSPVYGVWSWPYVMVEPTHWMPLPEAPGAQTQPAQSVPDVWLRAIDEALVVTHLGVANAGDSYEDAKRKLNELICWHTDVATDPAVNGGFKLVPIEPTEEMLEASFTGSLCFYSDEQRSSYQAMLAAAPEAKP